MLYLRPGGRGERAPWRQPVRPIEMQGTRAAAKARNTYTDQGEGEGEGGGREKGMLIDQIDRGGGG